MSEPIPLKVTRWMCPHCSRSHAKKPAATGHIARCWLNPVNRACKTCTHWEAPGNGEPCEGGRPCACNVYPQACDAGVELEPDDYPRTNCPKWEATR